MTDESAIFVTEESIFQTGRIFRMDKGDIVPLSEEHLRQMKI